METSSYQRHQEWVKQRRLKLSETLASLFPEPQSLTLEIGCGHGHWLVDFAAAHPERSCLGIDLIGDRIERARRKAERAGQGNARFLKAEAFEALDLMPAEVRLAEVFVLFPDPWPKKRHWKNRLFCQAFLVELAKRCASGTRLHFRTDHAGYFEWASEVVAAQELWQQADLALWPFETETVFQSKADSYESLILVKG